jgi:hypothetical protein
VPSNNTTPKSKPRTRLTPLGQKILTACLEQPTLERAAAAAGISVTTLWRHRQKPEFKQALSDVGRRGMAQALTRLQQVALAAANTQIRVLLDSASPPAIRLRAAEAILSAATESRREPVAEPREAGAYAMLIPGAPEAIGEPS